MPEVRGQRSEVRQTVDKKSYMTSGLLAVVTRTYRSKTISR